MRSQTKSNAGGSMENIGGLYSPEFIARVNEEFNKLGCAQLYDAGSRYCHILKEPLIPRSSTAKLAGPVFPVITRNDMLPVLQGLDACPPNWVLFIKNEADCSEALAGDIVATALLNQRLAGLVVDGAVRDVESYTELGVIVFSREVTFVSAKTAKLPAEILPHIIHYNDLAIEAGDYIFADLDGMILVKKKHLTAVINGAKHLLTKEMELKTALTNGGRLGELIGLNGFLSGSSKLKFNV